MRNILALIGLCAVLNFVANRVIERNVLISRLKDLEAYKQQKQSEDN